MSLTIRPVDPWDEREIDVVQEQYVAAQRAEVPDARIFSRAESVAMLSRPAGAAFYAAFVAFDGDATPDRMVGQAWVMGSTTDNLHLAHLWAWVPPAHARRGVGTALVRHAEAYLLHERDRRTG